MSFLPPSLTCRGAAWQVRLLALKPCCLPQMVHAKRRERFRIVRSQSKQRSKAKEALDVSRLSLTSVGSFLRFVVQLLEGLGHLEFCCAVYAYQLSKGPLLLT